MYERLQEKGFQRLCNALLTHLFPETVCMPVGQRDGGRDALRQTAKNLIVYQVKWSADPIRDPVVWLDAAVRQESDNIARLVREGATRYVLITSVAGTSPPKQGTMDRLRARLDDHQRALGVEMSCWWRADVDARLESAPDELLWHYVDMLAGHDLVKYLLHAPARAEHEEQLRELLFKVVAAQWEEDSRVKFKQVDLDTHALADLFVDVRAERLAVPDRADDLPVRGNSPSDGRDSRLGTVGGAADYLLEQGPRATRFPLTLVLGAPGQGKSTLAQYLCQAHRNVLLAEIGNVDTPNSSPPAIGDGAMPHLPEPRVPLRLDLRDYAMWISGHDPFAMDDPSQERRRKRPRKVVSVEAFLADWLHSVSGGRHVSTETVHEIIDRFPLLLVFDGLDEIADRDTRKRVVEQINRICARLRGCAWQPRVVVTARPTTSGLAEPSSAQFETLMLTPLSVELREAYLNKWAQARSLPPSERSALARIFRARSVEPHIAQLAENPMQLTILLYLIQKRGESIPTERTELYRSFMETFLDREAAKTPAVQRYRLDLEEVTAHLGWHLQSRAETNDDSGRLAVKELKIAIAAYLIGVGKDVGMVEELFTAVTDRVWALTSKHQGSFEFDVQPVQEYFAAKYLHEVAGTDHRQFDASEVFRQLLRRPYWANTCRFYAGFSKVNDLAALADVLETEFAESSPVDSAHVATATQEDPSPETTSLQHLRILTWQLLADGVFTPRPRSRASVAALLTDDLSARLLAAAVEEGAIPQLTIDRGAVDLTQAICSEVDRQPEHQINMLRTQLIATAHVGEPPSDGPDITAFDTWWQERLVAVAGTEHEAIWLRLGVAHAAGTRLPDSLALQLTLRDPYAADAALNAGIAVPEGTQAADNLLQAVLDGHCSDSEHITRCLAADLIHVMSPWQFLARASDRPSRPLPMRPHRRMTSVLGSHEIGTTSEQTAFGRLIRRDNRYEQLRQARRVSKGQKGTTSPWGNTARVLAALHGPCLLAAEIAVVGAAAPMERLITGGDITPGAPPFGPDIDYGQLIDQTRRHRSDISWWRDRVTAHPDPLSRATWALALLGVARDRVVTGCLDLLDEVLTTLPTHTRHALLLASSRLGIAGIARSLPAGFANGHTGLSPLTLLALSHHSIVEESFDALNSLPAPILSAMLDYGAASWPAMNAVQVRAANDPTSGAVELLRRCGPNFVSETHGIPKIIPRDLAQLVLVNCRDIPAFWVISAEKSLSERVACPPLANVAGEHRWFGDIPTIEDAR